MCDKKFYAVLCRHAPDPGDATASNPYVNSPDLHRCPDQNVGWTTDTSSPVHPRRRRSRFQVPYSADGVTTFMSRPLGDHDASARRRLYRLSLPAVSRGSGVQDSLGPSESAAPRLHRTGRQLFNPPNAIASNFIIAARHRRTGRIAELRCVNLSSRSRSGSSVRMRRPDGRAQPRGGNSKNFRRVL